MLLVKTKIGPSPIHGIGLFAAEFIPKGTRTWTFNPHLDKFYSAAEVERMPEPARTTFKNYCYNSSRSGNFVLCFDDARYMNHSDDANCLGNSDDVVEGEWGDVAVRDIQIGEEMTNDYKDFDKDFGYKMSSDIRN